MRSLPLAVDALAIALALLAWGAHALVPWTVARGGEDARRRWAHLAFPLLLAAVLAVLAAIAWQPDAAIATGLASLRGSWIASCVAVLTAATLAADLLLAFAWRELEPAGWRIAGGLGAAGAIAAMLAAEVLRVGEGPRTALPITVTAVVCRLLVALACGEALAAARPRLGLLALPALALYGLALPAQVGAGLMHDRVWVVAAAGAVILAVDRWLPPRLRRPAIAAATLLVALFFAAAAARSQLLANQPLPPPPPPIAR